MKKITFMFGIIISHSFIMAESTIPDITLYKDQYCGCCVEYAKYVENHNIKITSINHPKMSDIKYQYGTVKGASCHTMVAGDYVIEGHVPISSIQKLFNEKPDIKGIALPGMPASSPGMGPMVKGSLNIMAIEHSGEITKLFNQE